jgi:hypothetical protein
MSRAEKAIRHETPEEFAASLSALGVLFDLVHTWQLEREERFSVAPSSSFAGDDRDTRPYHMSHLVQQSLGVAVDHLHCLRAVQEASSIHTWAPYTLLRGSIEASATVAYLLGDKSRDVRVRRRLQMVNGDDMEQDTVAKLLGQQMSPSREDRLRRLRAVAARRPGVDVNTIGPRPDGYKIIVAIGGDACAIGSRLALAGWHLCSGFAHGRQWAAMSLLDRDEVTEVTEEVLSVRLTSSASTIYNVAQIAVLFAGEARRLFAQRATPPH